VTSVAPPPSAGRRVLPTLNEDGSRRWIRPKPSHGKWWERRRSVAYALMLVFFFIPHLRIGGRPVFLMDLPRRQFSLMGYTFLPTDTLLFMFALGSVVIGIFLATALFGRVWCGWACPQTVYLEFLFRPIGRWFDGGYTGSRNLDRQGRFFSRGRIAKYATFLVLSLFVAHTFLAYFVSTEQLFAWMRQSPLEHPTLFLTVVIMTGVVWFNFTYFREQTCLIVCPYGRWQAALVDRQSLIVAYDEQRGEPRALGVKHRADDAGDCIDCKACVQTCPTGIDIRDGLQMECVQCTQCIDACDDVMTRIGKPTGLIRYSTQDSIAGQPRKVLRPRIILYPAVLLVLLGGLAWNLFTKDTADITVLRGLQGPFVEEPDGTIANQVRVKIANRGRNVRSYSVVVEGLGDGDLRREEVRVVAPEIPLSVDGLATRSTSLFILLPKHAFTRGERMITLAITDGAGFTTSIPHRLLGPTGGSTP
jgi:cytochrome c oxidase accessory protein FixG